MATACTNSNTIRTFIYEDLISQVKKIQRRISLMESVLKNRLQNQDIKTDVLKSRLLTFIDPYGNEMTNNYMDHEMLNDVVNSFKKNYIPKFLHPWIQFGIKKHYEIEQLDTSQLLSNVSKYTNGSQFVTFVKVPVWIGTYEGSNIKGFVLNVLLNDTVETLKMRVTKREALDDVELRFYTITEGESPTSAKWDKGTILKPHDTILSTCLYDGKHVIMAKFLNDQVKY